MYEEILALAKAYTDKKVGNSGTTEYKHTLVATISGETVLDADAGTAGLILDEQPNITVGRLYRVVFDGTTYDNILALPLPKESGAEGVVLGDASKIGIPGEMPGVMVIQDGVPVLLTLNAGMHIVSIYVVELDAPVISPGKIPLELAEEIKMRIFLGKTACYTTTVISSTNSRDAIQVLAYSGAYYPKTENEPEALQLVAYNGNSGKTIVWGDTDATVS